MKVIFGLWFVVEPVCLSLSGRAPAPPGGETNVAQGSGPWLGDLILGFQHGVPGGSGGFQGETLLLIAIVDVSAGIGRAHV